LHLVPLAGARREMADRQLQADVVCQTLQGHLPQARPMAVAAAPIRRDEQFLCTGEAQHAHLFPPATDAGSGEIGRVVVDAHTHPALVVRDIIHPIGNRLPSFLSRKSWTRTWSGSPWGRHSRPAFLKSPTNSFFFVSTEITGWQRFWKRRAWALMYSNWALRSGCCRPSRVLQLACKL